MFRTRGFTLIEVLISGVLLATLMLAVMGVLTQAQRDMQLTTNQTEVTEKTRMTMEAVSTELRESSIDHLVAGFRGSGAGGLITRNVMSFPAERDMAQCPDQFCPWQYNTALASEREPHIFLVRNVQMDATATPFNAATPATWLNTAATTTVGRVWANTSSNVQCAAGHTYVSTTTAAVDMGAIMFASPRNREGRFVSLEGANRATDWQALVFLVPFARGANVVELRRYVVYIDDLVHDAALTAWSDVSGQGVVAPPAGETITTTAGAGASNGAFSVNVPAGKPTLTDLLDYDGDGATADGVFDIAGGTADATSESFTITTAGTQSFIQYIKNGVGGTANFSITIDRDSGDTTWAINHTYAGGVPAPAFVKTITIRGRRPTVVASNIRDIEFATIRNCPYSATNNPTGLLAPQDTNVVRVTTFFDKVLTGRNLNSVDAVGNQVVRAATAQEVVVTRVQPRN